MCLLLPQTGIIRPVACLKKIINSGYHQNNSIDPGFEMGPEHQLNVSWQGTFL